MQFDEEKYNGVVQDITNDNLKDQTGMIKSCCNILGSISADTFKRNLSTYIDDNMEVYQELKQVIFERK